MGANQFGSAFEDPRDVDGLMQMDDPGVGGRRITGPGASCGDLGGVAHVERSKLDLAHDNAHHTGGS